MADNQTWWNGLGPEFWDSITIAERRGWITYGDLSAVLPPTEVLSAELEDLFAWLNDRGVEVVEIERG